LGDNEIKNNIFRMVIPEVTTTYFKIICPKHGILLSILLSKGRYITESSSRNGRPLSKSIAK
jgi:hypothetical protein